MDILQFINIKYILNPLFNQKHVLHKTIFALFTTLKKNTTPKSIELFRLYIYLALLLC